MKSFKTFCCATLLLTSAATFADVCDTTAINPLGYSKKDIQQQQVEQFDSYMSILKSYDITITKPETFSILDTRGREDIATNNINPQWHRTIDVRNSPVAAIMEANNQEAAFIIHNISLHNILLPKVRDAGNIEFELRNSHDNMELDVTPMISIIAEKDMSRYACADTAAIYEFDFKKPFVGQYKHCIGIYLQKAAHPALLLKVALNDKGYEKKDDYIQLFLDNVCYGNSPDILLTYNENSIDKNSSEFNFPTRYRTYTGILPDINDETLEEINRSKAWLEAHGMQELPKISDDVLDALNKNKAGREQNQAQTDSIENTNIPENQKIYPPPVLERKPQFPGEHPFSAENKWIEQNLKYPADAKRKGLQGRVSLDFTVMTDGSIDNITIREASPDVPSFKREAIRLIKSMPKWIPAKYKGKEVCANWFASIYFKLPPEQRAKIAAKVKPSDPVEKSNVRDYTISAEFPGGTEALNEWIAKNINYSDEVIEAIKSNQFNDIMVDFTIDRDGSIIKPCIRMLLNRALSLEALRVIEKMPKWIPAFRNEKPVQSRTYITVKFKLPEK